MRKDLTGQIFGQLTVLEPTGGRAHGCIEWRCQCACGWKTRLPARSLVSGRTTSCGCKLLSDILLNSRDPSLTSHTIRARSAFAPHLTAKAILHLYPYLFVCLEPKGGVNVAEDFLATEAEKLQRIEDALASARLHPADKPPRPSVTVDGATSRRVARMLAR